MNEKYILHMPLVRAFALLAAAAPREGRKTSGPTLADLDLQDAINRATAEYNASR